MLSAFEILELFCELLQVRMALIQQSKTVMDDTREAIASVIYAAQRLPDLPELIVVRAQFANKFGKEFCVECNSDEKAVEKGVNRGLFNALSVATPSGLKKLTTLQFGAPPSSSSPGPGRQGRHQPREPGPGPGHQGRHQQRQNQDQGRLIASEQVQFGALPSTSGARRRTAASTTRGAARC